MRSKLKYPDVQDYLNNFYIVVILEGYTSYSKRRSKCTQSSGGNGIFVRNILVNFIKIIHRKSDSVIWCKIKYTNYHDLLLMGTAYIPPGAKQMRIMKILRTYVKI